MSVLNEYYLNYGDLRCPIASSVLGIGAKIRQTFAVFLSFHYDAILFV